MPEARRVSMARLRSDDGLVLDQALVVWLPGPATATGEDLVELHLHGGRAVVGAVEAALGTMPGMRKAEPGEFTRRAFANGRIDLAEAEGLADLLTAETEMQRQAAMLLAEGSFSREIEAWREEVLRLSALLESTLDFADEDDVGGLAPDFFSKVALMSDEISARLAAPRARILREGYRVVLAGPPNAGKSTLFNALVERDAAITSPIAGTTRDVIERPVALRGVPFVFADTAGLRGEGMDAIEAIGIERATRELERADLILWLGPEGVAPEGAWEIDAQIDRETHEAKSRADFAVSAVTGEGVPALREALIERASSAMPKPGETALNERQASLLGVMRDALVDISPGLDLLLIAENLRRARLALDRLVGRAATEDMLDALFGRFCIGK